MVKFDKGDAHGGGVGVIYVLADREQKISKIGRTISGTAAGRATSYGKVHGHQWTVFAQQTTLRVVEVEANIHSKLWVKRINTSTNAKEIFKIKPAEVADIVRSFIIAPGGTFETQREAILNHTRRVRMRLKEQERYLQIRSARSTIAGSTIVETEVYPQYIALDALERGISVDELMAQYRQMLNRRRAEETRIKEAHSARWNAAWQEKSWWSKMFGETPYIATEEIDSSRYPPVPHYAVDLIHREDGRRLAAARRAAYTQASKPK